MSISPNMMSNVGDLSNSSFDRSDHTCTVNLRCSTHSLLTLPYGAVNDRKFNFSIKVYFGIHYTSLNISYLSFLRTPQ